jgi:hypothetical protein
MPLRFSYSVRCSRCRALVKIDAAQKIAPRRWRCLDEKVCQANTRERAAEAQQRQQRRTASPKRS